MRRFFRYLWRGLLVVLLVGLIYVGIKLPETSQLAADISAKWACQCRYIDGGDDAFCIAEDPVGFGGTDFSFDPESSSVTTDVWGAVSSTATYKPGWGCMVQ